MVVVDSWLEVDWSEHVHDVIVGGRVVRYLDYGAGPPLLLVHGMAGSWQTWVLNLAALGERYRVIAVDLPGFGGSEPLPAGARFGGYLRILRGLLDELQIDRVPVFGHSLGGLVALSFAAARPERVDSLVLVSAGGVELSRARLKLIRLAFWLFRLLLVVPGVRRALARGNAGRFVLSPAVHHWRDLSSDLVDQMMPWSIGPGFMEAVQLGSEQLDELRPEQVQVPVLLVWGRRDRILPLRAARDLVARLEQAQLVVLDDVGHCAMFEAPEDFDDLALNFLGMRQADHERRPVAGPSREWMTRNNDSAERYIDGNVG